MSNVSSTENLSLTCDVEEDAFATMFSYAEFRVIAVFFCAFQLSVGNFLLYSILWYDANGNPLGDTIIQQMTSSILHTCSFHMLLMRPLELCRVFLGPLPAFACDLRMALDNFTIGFVLVSVNIVAVFRYLCIFHYWRVGGVNQSLAGRFLTLCNSLVNGLASAAYFALADHGGDVRHRWCTGVAEGCIEQGSNRFSEVPAPYTVIACLTIFLQVFVEVRIWRFKKQLSTDNSDVNSNSLAKDNAAMFFACLLTLAAVSPTVLLWIFDADDGWSNGRAGAVSASLNLFARSAILTMAYAVAVYGRNKEMRKFVWRELVLDNLRK